MHPKIQEGDFQETINNAIKEGRHVNYLQAVLEKYGQYKEAFENVFTSKNPENNIYKFKATYLQKKPVWRDIELLGNQSFFDLAEEIIASMDWISDHMHGFDIPGTEREPDPLMTGSSKSFFAPGWEDDPHPTYKTVEIRICDVDYNKLPKLDFTFDYGDGHEFKVEFKSMRKMGQKDNKTHFPQLVDQRGVAPEQYPAYD